MVLSSHMNNNRLSSNILPASPAAAGEAQTTNLDSTQPARAAQLLTVRSCAAPEFRRSTKENLNYNLLVEKVKKLLSKPSNF